MGRHFQKALPELNWMLTAISLITKLCRHAQECAFSLTPIKPHLCDGKGYSQGVGMDASRATPSGLC
jgi:hypothetical protein